MGIFRKKREGIMTDSRLDSVAIIMDGNGRWAKRRGLPRSAGHLAGAKIVQRVLEIFREMGVHYVTLYAFSTENWKRPKDEVDALMKLVEQYRNATFFHGHALFGDYEYAERVVKESSGNSYLELTAVPGENGMIEKFCELVGSEKLIFGTDLPWFDEFQAIGGVVSAKISDEAKRNILHDNVERILGKEW